MTPRNESANDRVSPLTRIVGLLGLILLASLSACSSAQHSGTEDSASTAPPPAAAAEKPEVAVDPTTHRPIIEEGHGGLPTAPPHEHEADTAAPWGTASVQNLIDEAVSQLHQATVAFNTPTKIPLGASQRISLVLSFDTAAAALKNDISAQGPTDTAQISAAPEMEALLVGSSGLTVRALQSSPKRAVPSHGVEQWDWDIEANAAGPQTLTLSVSAVLAAPGAPEYTIQTYARTLEVTVSDSARVWQFITHNWQWLWTVIVIPIAGLLWRRFGQRPKP